MPQMSIFQQLTELGHTWKDYQQNKSIEDALWYEWVWNTGNDKLVVDYYEEFHQDIENGTLPDFVYINPSCCGPHTTSMHPNGAVSDGEAFLKDVYESLRNSKYWEETLIIVVFDEGGGFHDHVAPPLAIPPDNLTYTELTPAGDYTLFQPLL
jgi:phospholipase C